MLKIAPEGWPFVAGCTLSALALAAWSLLGTGVSGQIAAVLTLLLVALAFFMLYFFRDPQGEGRIFPQIRPDGSACPRHGDAGIS